MAACGGGSSGPNLHTLGQQYLAVDTTRSTRWAALPQQGWPFDVPIIDLTKAISIETDTASAVATLTLPAALKSDQEALIRAENGEAAALQEAYAAIQDPAIVDQVFTQWMSARAEAHSARAILRHDLGLPPPPPLS
jgi:hypothetical protein